MKKILFIVLAICLMATVAQAVEPKVSYFWEADNSEFIKLIGTSVQEDVAGIKGLDIDVWYKWSRPETEIKYDEVGLNNLVMPGVSYMVDVKGFDVGLNAGIGLDRIESIDTIGQSELKYGIGICLGKKF